MDLRNLVYIKETELPGSNPDPQSVFMSPDGTKLFGCNYETQIIEQFDLSVPFDITTISTSGISKDLALGNDLQDFHFNEDGTICIVYAASTLNEFVKYILSTPWDVSTMVSSQNFNPSITELVNFWINSDGSGLWLSDSSTNRIKYFSMTDWDLSTLVNTGDELYVWETGTTPNGFSFSKDGQYLFITTNFDETEQDIAIKTWELTVPWDITTAVFIEANVFWPRDDNLNSDLTEVMYETGPIFFTGPISKQEYFYIWDRHHNVLFCYDLPIYSEFNGSVLEENESVSRTVRLYNRNTGKMVEETISSVDGSFLFSKLRKEDHSLVEEGLQHYVVVLDADNEDFSYNSLAYMIRP